MLLLLASLSSHCTRPARSRADSKGAAMVRPRDESGFRVESFGVQGCVDGCLEQAATLNYFEFVSELVGRQRHDAEISGHNRKL